MAAWKGVRFCRWQVEEWFRSDACEHGFGPYLQKDLSRHRGEEYCDPTDLSKNQKNDGDEAAKADQKDNFTRERDGEEYLSKFG